MQRSAKKPNVILIVMDTTRYDSLSCYGYHRKTTPNIDKIAEEGIVFENAISTAPWTLPAHASMLSGMYPSEHNLTEGNISLTKNLLPKSLNRGLNNYLPQLLSDHGYNTVGFSNNPWISSEFGFNRGFKSFYEIWKGEADSITKKLKKKIRQGIPPQFRPLLRKLSVELKMRANADSGAKKTIALVDKWFKEHYVSGTNFFAFFNFMESHAPCMPPEPFRRLFMNKNFSEKEVRNISQDSLKFIAGEMTTGNGYFEILRALYDGEIAYLDLAMKTIFDKLEELNILDSTMIIITSDHGENIGEHGLMSHQFCIYESLVHVPLIIRYPELFPKGTRQEKYVQSSDIFFTILDLLDIKTDEDDMVSRRSLLNKNYNEYVVSEYDQPVIRLKLLKARFPHFDTNKFNRELKAIYSDGFKYIWSSDGKNELYELTRDKKEEVNVIQQFPQMAAKLGEKLNRWVSLHQREMVEEDVGFQEVDEEIKEKLAALGYL